MYRVLNSDAEQNFALTRTAGQLADEVRSTSHAQAISYSEPQNFPRLPLGGMPANGRALGAHPNELFRTSDELGPTTVRLLAEFIPWGVVGVSPQLDIVFVNQLAIEISSRPQAGMKVRDGRFRLARSCADRTLNELLSMAVDEDAHRQGGRAFGAVCVPDAQGRPHYALQVFSAAGSLDAPMAIIIIMDLRAAEIPRRASLAKVFSLTDKEAALTELFGHGNDLETIAAAMGISENTARVHLRNVFLKTGVANQVSLARLLGRLSDGRGGPLVEV